MLIGKTVYLKARHALLISSLAVWMLVLVACTVFGQPLPTEANPTSEPTQAVASQPTEANPISEPTQAVAATVEAAPTQASPLPKPTQPDATGRVSLEIGTASAATAFSYNPATLEAPAGSKIKLKFSNKTDPKDEVGHSWVLVKAGQEESVIANAIAAGDDKDWLQEDDPGIIAHTALIEGEQNRTITFDAPIPGTYTFLCTFPDHYKNGMQGTLIIK